MMFKRLTMMGACALASFAAGRWLSAPARASVPLPTAATPMIHSPATDPVPLPQPDRAGRVPFIELYRGLRSSSPGDQAAFLSSLEKLPSGPDRRAAVKAFFQVMSSVSPTAAADLVRQVGKEDMRRAAMAVMGAAPATSTSMLVKMLVDLPAGFEPEWRSQQIRSQMYFWAALDPAAAAQFADEYQNTDPELPAHGIIECLAAADPTAAARWLEEHPALREEPGVISQYVSGLYTSDPAQARRYVTEHATESPADAALKSIARRSFVDSADDALQFIKQLPTKEARTAALDGITNLNVDLFAKDEGNRTSLYAGVAQWVVQFPEDEWPTTMSLLLDQWRQVDPEGSVSWMAQLPSPARSRVAGELVRAVSDTQLKEVLASASGGFRHDVLAAFAQTLSSAPEERDESIQMLGLSPEDAAQLGAIGQVR